MCLQDLQDENEKYVAVRVCKHLFHHKCLVDWLRSHQTCPLCRTYVLEQAEGEVVRE